MGITNKDVLKTVLKVPQLEEKLEDIETRLESVGKSDRVYLYNRGIINPIIGDFIAHKRNENSGTITKLNDRIKIVVTRGSNFGIMTQNQIPFILGITNKVGATFIKKSGNISYPVVIGYLKINPAEVQADFAYSRYRVIKQEELNTEVEMSGVVPPLDSAGKFMSFLIQNETTTEVELLDLWYEQ